MVIFKGCRGEVIVIERGGKLHLYSETLFAQSTTHFTESTMRLFGEVFLGVVPVSY